MIKGFILIHVMEFYESHVDPEKIEELKKSNLPFTTLLREALVYSNDYNIEILHEYEQLLKYCKLSDREFLYQCGRYLGENIFDHFFYIYRGKGIYPFLEALQNLFPFIFGPWTFNFSVQTQKTRHHLTLELEPSTPLPEFFITILAAVFKQMLSLTGVNPTGDFRYSVNEKIILMETEYHE
jgi:hypothetical protein